jgi:hypothetical protein
MASAVGFLFFFYGGGGGLRGIDCHTKTGQMWWLSLQEYFYIHTWGAVTIPRNKLVQPSSSENSEQAE